MTNHISDRSVTVGGDNNGTIRTGDTVGRSTGATPPPQPSGREDKSNRTQIIVAAIALVSAVIVAVIANFA